MQIYELADADWILFLIQNSGRFVFFTMLAIREGKREKKFAKKASNLLKH